MADASELARALAARRPRITTACEVCGTEFEAWKRKTQQPRTCSPACRQKLWRQAHRADPAPIRAVDTTLGTSRSR